MFFEKQHGPIIDAPYLMQVVNGLSANSDPLAFQLAIDELNEHADYFLMALSPMPPGTRSALYWQIMHFGGDQLKPEVKASVLACWLEIAFLTNRKRGELHMRLAKVLETCGQRSMIANYGRPKDHRATASELLSESEYSNMAVRYGVPAPN